MFSFCTDPSTLETYQWFACYFTTGKDANFYWAFVTVILLLAVTAPTALAMGFGGASAARSRIAPVRWLGHGYISVVRGVPDIAFFLFFVIALDQGLEFLRHSALCPDWDQPIRQGNDFIVCDAAKLPLGNAPQWVHEVYGFALAVFTFAIVFGAFAANVLYGAMQAVPRAQLETAEAYGMTHRQTFWRILVPQMWVYALPGLSNLWMVLIKATPCYSCWVLKTSFTGRANWAAQLTRASQTTLTAIGACGIFCFCWCSISPSHAYPRSC